MIFLQRLSFRSIQNNLGVFTGRKLAIGTKHNKETVISPMVEQSLGVKSVVAEFDTDTLGTFSGEIERESDPISTVRQKCLLAMDYTGCNLGIASEGSFGPHPVYGFIPADDEILIFIDRKNDLEIVVREISTDTNFNGQEVDNLKDLIHFAETARFPSHGLILKKSKEDFSELIKGIADWNSLKELAGHFIQQNGRVYVETDMRAMLNPTRMGVIKAATKKLIEKIKNLCPICNTPGFGVTSSKEGLPCELCHHPTRSILYYQSTCIKCDYSSKEIYPNGKKFEDPMYCDHCNP